MATMVGTEVPQHMRALDKANRFRLTTAEWHHQVAAGERSLADLIREQPPELGAVSLERALRWQHRWGRQRVGMLLARVARETRQDGLPVVLEGHRLIGSLTARQAAAVADRL